ncbi:MAG: hypothetical protein BWY20_02336 [Spirochaetes bacterium ADurb.Bin215]|nr:MAG: hypothetical protein BWY20_02336 [Spirochaetes bacterium ADurb.Bin215]
MHGIGKEDFTLRRHIRRVKFGIKRPGSFEGFFLTRKCIGEHIIQIPKQGRMKGPRFKPCGYYPVTEHTERDAVAPLFTRGNAKTQAPLGRETTKILFFSAHGGEKGNPVHNFVHIVGGFRRETPGIYLGKPEHFSA